jgi:hypothetical protein
MKPSLLAGALALAVTLSAAPVQADDPNDPAMRSAAARARDRETIRQMNLDQLARVRARDAQYADGWRAYREAHARGEAPAPRYRSSRDAERRAIEARRVAEQRRAQALCEDGYNEYCDD